jgi:hypothetical protein
VGEVVVVAAAVVAAAAAAVRAKADSRDGRKSAAVAGYRAVGGCCLLRRRRRKGEGQSDLPWLRLELVVVSGSRWWLGPSLLWGPAVRRSRASVQLH